MCVVGGLVWHTLPDPMCRCQRAFVGISSLFPLYILLGENTGHHQPGQLVPSHTSHPAAFMALILIPRKHFYFTFLMLLVIQNLSYHYIDCF